MAEGAIIRMRLHEWRDHGGMVAPMLNLPKSVTATQPWTIHINVEGTPADVAGFSGIDPCPTTLGVSTAVAIEILSADNKDNGAAGGAVQSVNIIGIDGNNNLVNKTQAMHAATGTTVVTSTDLYKEVFHTYANSWGTEDKDAEGNITVQKIDDTDLCLILATKNESEGSSFLVPDGCVAMLVHAHLKRLAPAAGVYAADEGVRIRIVYINPVDGSTGLVAGDRAANWIELEAVGEFYHEANHEGGHIFEAGTWITHQHSSKVNAGELYSLNLEYIVWKK